MGAVVILRSSLCALVFFLFCSISYAQSQRPTPEEGEQATESTASNQHKPPESPPSVEPVPAPTTQGESSQEAKAKDEKLIEKGLLLVALFQLLTFIAQAVILGKSLRSTKLAANAAKESANALPTIERAYVFVKVYLSQNFIADKGVTEYTAQISIVNGGKTPAVLLDCIYTTRIVGLNDELPEISKTNSDKPWIPPGIVRANYERTELAVIQTNAAEMKSVEACLERLVCYGVIRYEDVFGKAHETGFCWEYQARIKDFYPAKDHKRNYRT
jgi:hypothetical protein